MKKNLLLTLVSFLIFPISLFSQTSIPAGAVSGTWNASGSPYLINGDIIVENGESLVIEPGVVIEFTEHYRFTVEGNLKALGNSDQMIRFTIGDTTGLADRDSHEGSWNGLVFLNADDTCIVDYCIIEYCNTWEDLSPYFERSPITGFYSTLIISNSIIRNTYSMLGPIKIDYGDFQILNNLIEYNTGYNTSGGIYTNTNGPKIIEGNTIVNNKGKYGGAIYLGAAGLKVIVRNNFISQNSALLNGGGIASHSDASAQITQNIIVNNRSSYGGGIHFQNSGMILLNNTICNNYASGEGGGLFFTDATLMNGQNNIIWSNKRNTTNNNVYASSNSFPSFIYNLIEDGESSFSGSIANIASSNMTTGNPVFVNPTAGPGINFASTPEDWKLTSESPCLNIGSTEEFGEKIPEKDFFGDNRISYELIDLGSQEFNVASVDVSSDINTPTLWIADTIRITNNINVYDKLIIAPGVVVKFMGYYGISFYETLFAVGTENNPVKFMMADTTGLGDLGVQTGTYNTLQFINTSGIIIKYCEFRHAKHINFNQCDDLVFSNNLVEYCKADYSLLYFRGYNINILDNTFRNNTNLQGSYYRVMGTDSEKILIMGNKIYNNKLSVIESYGNNLKFINNLVYNNEGRVILLREGYNAVFLNNTMAYNSEAIRLEAGSSYIANNILYGNGNTEIASLIYVDEIHIYNNMFGGPRNRQPWEINTDNIIDDPLFRNPYPVVGISPEVMSADYSIMDISPAINMGFNEAKDMDLISKDVLGNERINDGTVDIGAMENQGSLPVVRRQPRGGSFCEDEAFELSLVPESNDTMFFQWRFNGEDITGENSRQLSFDSLGLEDIGYYTCIIRNAYGDTESFPAAINVKSKPVILYESESGELCQGDPLVMEINGAGTLPLFFKWKKDGELIPLQNKQRLIVPVTNQEHNGTYMAFLANQCGVDSTSEMNILIHPLPVVNLGRDSALCANSDFVLDPGEFYSYLWNDFTADRYKDVDHTGEYFVRVVDDNGCEAHSDTVNMQVNVPFADQSICIVTVDQEAGKNLIAWNRIEGVGVTSYNIYKLFGSNFVPIGNVPIGDITQFIDYSSSPDAIAARYAISVVDTCGNESEYSNYHQTIHLGASEGITPNTVVLDWTDYLDEGGIIQPEWYYIFRGDDPENMLLHDSVSSTFTEWNDLDPGNSRYYQVGIKPGSPCNPDDVIGKKAGSGPFVHSLSNLEDNRLQTGLSEFNQAGVSIYPNPAVSTIHVEITANIELPVTVSIIDMTGRQWLENRIQGSATELDVSSLNPGIYILEIDSDNPIRKRFLKMK